MKIAGIDVSSKTVTLVIDQAGRTGKPREFRNTPGWCSTGSDRVISPSEEGKGPAGNPSLPVEHHPFFFFDGILHDHYVLSTTTN